MKKNTVLFIYMIVFMNFATAGLSNIEVLSNVLFKSNMKRGIRNDFTYYTLSKQNNRASLNYVSGSPSEYIMQPKDINQKYQVKLSNYHYTVIRTKDNFIINGNGSNGTVAQKSGTNVCELLATDNSLYLNNFDNLCYSNFSRRLQSMKYNDDLILFYIIVETYSRKTSYFQANISTINYTNDTFDEIFRSLLIEYNFVPSEADIITQDFSNMINHYAKNIFGNDKNINNITSDEFKRVMFEIFTQIKHRMRLTGEFDPLVDTPHLLRVFDYSDNEIKENNKIIIEKYNMYIKEYLLKKTINDLYLSSNKNVHDYHDFIHNSSDGFNYGLSYNIGQNTKDRIFNVIGVYEKNFVNSLSVGTGLNFARYDLNSLRVISNGMLYLKIKNDILSSNIGLYYGKLFNLKNTTNNLVNFKFNNRVYGYFIRFYKYLNVNANFLEKIELSSSYFRAFYNISNIISRNLGLNQIHNYDDANFNDNYFYNIISFYLSCFQISNGLINLSFGIKNIAYLNNSYFYKNNRYINSLFIQNNVKIKNSNLNIDLNMNIKNIKNFNLNIMFMIDL